MHTSRNALVWLLLSALVIGLDQLSKALVLDSLVLGQPVPVINRFMNWTLAYNDGAAFSFLQGAGGWQRWIFSALAIVVSAVLVNWLRKTPRGDWRNALPLALVIGGALGNLIDRVRFGHVIDFVDVYWGDAHFPVFNVADSAISVGAVLLIAFALFGGQRTRAGEA